MKTWQEISRKYDLSVRASRVMVAIECDTPKKLSEKTRVSLLRLRNCGSTTIEELEEFLARNGLAFKPEKDTAEPFGWYANREIDRMQTQLRNVILWLEEKRRK